MIYDLNFVGDLIKLERKRLGITQSALAEASGISRATINALENYKVKDIGVNRVNAIINSLKPKEGHETNKVAPPKFAFPYAWSNQNPTDEMVIRGVLERCIFEDMVGICMHYGIPRVLNEIKNTPWSQDVYMLTVWNRMITNIQKGLNKNYDTQENKNRTELGKFPINPNVLLERTKSKDIFDIMQLMQTSGFTMKEVLSVAKSLDPVNCSEETIISVLTGAIPLDKDDEGFSCNGTALKINEIYDYFKTQVAEHEVESAHRINFKSINP